MLSLKKNQTNPKHKPHKQPQTTLELWGEVPEDQGVTLVQELRWIKLALASCVDIEITM